MYAMLMPLTVELADDMATHSVESIRRIGSLTHERIAETIEAARGRHIGVLRFRVINLVGALVRTRYTDYCKEVLE